MFKALVPVLVRVTEPVLLVVLTTWLPKVMLEEGVKETPGAVPVPLRAIVCVPPEASSVIVTVPVRVPMTVGVKVTLMAQVFEVVAGTGVPGAQVVEGSRAKSPLMASAAKFRLLVPLLLRVTDSVPLVVFTTWLPKVRLEEGVKATPGAIPVPVSATALVPALEAMLRLPVRVPVAVGIKTTPTWQVFEVRGVEVEQVVVVESTAKSPLAVRAVSVRLLVPGLLTVTVSAPVVFPTTSLPKVSVEVEKPRAGAMPVPVSATVCVLPATPLLLSMRISVPLRDPVPAGVKVTLRVHVPPEAGTGVLVVQGLIPLVNAKSPLLENPVRLKLLVPVLVRVTDWTVLAVSTTWLPKVMLEEGVKETPGAVPVPLRATV
jgi:hypothetical protein